jgi:hypothetical protein
MDRFGKYLLVLFVVVLPAFNIPTIQPDEAQVERVTTSCTTFVDNIVEGQPVTATIQMSPATPTGEGYTVIVYLKSPNGVGASSQNGPWVYGISTNPNGKATVTFDVPTYSGKWYVYVDFGGRSYSNNSIFYTGGTWQTEFTISPIKTPTPSTTATPTASPIPTDNSTPTPTVSEFSVLTVLPFFVSIFLIAVYLKNRRTIYE